MAKISTKILNQSIDLNYEEKNKNKLLNLIEKLNNRLKKYNHLNGKVSDSKVIILTALEIEDDLIEQKKSTYKENSNTNENNQKLSLEIINLKDKISLLEKKLDEKNKIDFVVEDEIDKINKKLENINKSIISFYEE